MFITKMGVIRRSSFDLLKDSKQLVRVRSDGQVSFNPGGVIRSFCQLDLFLFPYDVQRCHIEFEAWRYNMSKQRFGKIPVVMSKLFLLKNGMSLISIRKPIFLTIAQVVSIRLVARTSHLVHFMYHVFFY